MGLDMYLYIKQNEYRSKYISEGHLELKYPKDITEFIPEPPCGLSVSRETSYQVGYWRKANHIHKWFVDTCANGEDDCNRIYLSIAQVEELLSLCKQVQADHTLAPSLLPTQEGFFFGSTDYDDYYFEDIKHTIEIIKPLLAFMNHKWDEEDYTWEVYYEASW